MSYNEDEYLLLSGIQHFAFCRRQWALIHLEEQWEENRLTAEGRAQHKHAHDIDFKEKRKELLVCRGLLVSSSELGLSGACDVVEFHMSEYGAHIHGHRGLWQPYPVEYKHGKYKDYSFCDEYQLCAQAMCLEDMLGCEVPKGALFYQETKRRTEIYFSDEIRNNVKSIAGEMHEYARRNQTPKSKPRKACRSCSIKEICLPQITNKPSVSKYMFDCLDGDDS